ncbi:gamma-glutamyl phosphate reductase [Pullulanibacillus camelliae]|uniref:Gamma-glutamyl phosphate reductase n=1 Tax=Pullulanibacillus camelliae TaxID=1707096 RepID=A0A8J2VWW1_9BACL|nr:glutamate-5-semialdehyde dehydrogenase [Pullulanibacillus camelliae]GGE40175.1 gamma-glutamyl phosphate reductase [Pullulanibacillus camelliae]
MTELINKAKRAKTASQKLNQCTTKQKNDALHCISQALQNQASFIIGENLKDLELGKANGLNESLLDRLMLNETRIKAMATALEQLIALKDPTGQVLESWQRPNELTINKVSVPLGVIGMIYEARPNVTVDAASLCLKTGNAVMLRGSSSAHHSNCALLKVIHDGLKQSALPVDAVQLIEDTRRETAQAMFQLKDYLDVLIPRGGKQLIQTVVEQANVPVLETGAGNCHVYIDETADPELAISITINAKTQRPSVCNAIETVLIHEKWAKHQVEHLINTLIDHGVELRADHMIRALDVRLQPATEEDWETEYLDHILALKQVANVEEAVEHINQYGTKHSEAIISETKAHVDYFYQNVDAAAVYHNASTRFTDGFEFGFGAEIGISTQKLHARGPMGLSALTTTKYLIAGTGQIRE